jgi:hypothetical protein
MFGKESSGGGRFGGNRGSGLSECRVAEVKAVRRAPGGVERRVDVVMKGEDSATKLEKASVYMKRKNTEKLKNGKKYEFELEPGVMDKDRGGGSARMGGDNRKVYRCETPPSEMGSGGGFKSFGSGKKKNLGKWYSS